MRAHHNASDLDQLIFDASQHEPILQPKGDFWFFAYGSLMWNPEFDCLRSESAKLYGYQRRLCLWSVAYRGTIDHPGLVMGLDHGGSCVGRALLISENSANKIIEKLNHREMVTGAYQSLLKTVHLQSGERVSAVCLMARRDHPQYISGLDVATTAEIVQHAAGPRGTNRDYVLNTVQHLREMGIVAGALEAVAKQLG